MEFKDLVGKTMVEAGPSEDKSEFIFKDTEGNYYRLYHSQECCESVSIEDICGSPEDLIGYPILQAEESTSNTNPEDIKKEYQDSFTWTFYRITTMKGQVVIRWYGESNGYYSEGVNFEKISS